MTGEDPALKRLRQGWATQSPWARDAVLSSIRRAAKRAVRPYLTESYGLDGYTDEDAAQVFVEHVLERWGVSRVADALRRASTVRAFETFVELKAGHWALERRRTRFGGKLHRRIRELPDRAARFVWVVRARWIALADGSKTCADGDRDELAGRVAGTSAARAFVQEVHARDSPLMHTLRDVSADVLVAHAAAARDVLVLDVLLVLAERHDTRPTVLREMDPHPPCPDRVGLHDDAAAVVDELLSSPAAKSDPALAERLEDLDTIDDGPLRAAVVAAMSAAGVEPQDRAIVLALAIETLAAGDGSQAAA